MSRLTQLREAAQHVRNPGESERVRNMVGIIAEIERAQRAQLLELHEALDIEGLDDVDDVEDRVDELCEFISGYTSKDLRDYWLEYQAPEDLSADVKPYLDLDDQEWENQIGRWAESYRANADLSDVSDRDIANQHVRNRFGLSLTEFEQHVVSWSFKETMEEALTGPLERNEDAIADAVAAVEEGQA